MKVKKKLFHKISGSYRYRRKLANSTNSTTIKLILNYLILTGNPFYVIRARFTLLEGIPTRGYLQYTR